MKDVIKPVYKVVQVYRNDMLSVNTHHSVMSFTDSGRFKKCRHVIKYTFNKVSYPNKGDSFIYVVDEANKNRCFDFYQKYATNKNVRILFGYACNPVTFLNNVIHYKEKTITVPQEFATTLCDWFLPIRFEDLATNKV